jgi:hypothetical protein
MHVSWLFLFILSFAVFRMTRLLVFDRITEFIRAPFFEEIKERDENGEWETYLVPKKGGIRGFIGELLSCYWCMGIWVTGFVLAAYWWYPTISFPFILLFSIAGLAAIIESVLQHWFN